jgi:SAM-dependent methyltransferase
MPNKINTSWGKDADWYQGVVTDNDSYQQNVILPNLLRLMTNIPHAPFEGGLKGEKILDVGCGTGFFSKEFAKAGGVVTGVDVGEELLNIARKNVPKGKFIASSAEDMKAVASESVDKAVIVLALQNIADAGTALKECGRILKKDGQLFVVLNHPVLRIPQSSSWGWDPHLNPLPKGEGRVRGIQYRRLDSYLSEKKIKIQMHPGDNPEEHTWSFHRPLQVYFKMLFKAGFVVERLEEWVSHRITPVGTRKEAENRSRAEFPLFLALVATKR